VYVGVCFPFRVQVERVSWEEGRGNFVFFVAIQRPSRVATHLGNHCTQSAPNAGLLHLGLKNQVGNILRLKDNSNPQT
jgi:hypothetical protein